MGAELGLFNRWRDDYVAGMRRLINGLGEALPDDLQGILSRSEALVAQQRPALDALASLDLDGPLPLDGGQQIVQALARAQHLPNMLVALSRVLVQEEQDEALSPTAERATELAARLAILTQAWVLRHQEALDAVDDEGDWI